MIGEALSGLVQGYRHLQFDALESTNTFLIEQALAGEPGNLWVTSGIQTVGKGSRGRSWTSEPGNLYASLLLIDPAPKSHLAELTFVASLAGRDAVLEACREVREGLVPEVQLKWPNDLMLNGAKCAGILLEGGDLQGLSYVVIGNGINCATCPSDTLHAATTLEREGFAIEPQMLFSHLSAAFAKRIKQWDRGEGFAEIRADWLQHVYGLNQQVAVMVPGKGTLKGRFASIDDNGYMLLDQADGTRQRISTADIFFVTDTTTSGEEIV